MAYFSAMGGSTAGAGATLTVTYSEDFYGTTITATNGTRTLTKLATSSGSVEFKLPEDGTWTVSATVGGQTYSESVLVDTSYEAELTAFPTGSTATPVNVIQTWLKCAQIKDKNYTTLSQVLNDTATLEALVSDSNACDYMVRSTNWASGIAADANAMALIGKFDYCANKLLSNATWAEAIAGSTYFESVLNVKVPTMTSNTTPSGVVTASTYNQTYYPFNVFDNNISSYWETSSEVAGSWIAYEFTSEIKVSKVKVTPYGYQYSPKNAKIQAYANGAWSDVTNILCQDDRTEQSFHIDLPVSSNKWRLYVVDNYGKSTVNISELQFYGRAESTMIPLVPKMTSNTTPSGEVIFSNQLVSGSTKGAWTAFNPSEAEGWRNDNTMPYIHVGNYVGYTFTSAVKVTKATFALLYYNITGVTISGKFQGYDGSDWVDVCDAFTYTISNTSSTPIDVPFTKNIDAYTKYRWICTTDPSSNKHTGVKLQFYTSADPATQVLFRSAAEDDLYYMDNGSPVIIAHTDWNGYAIVDKDLLPEGVNLTVYSTVAKDPANLGSAYSRVIHFSKYLTEVYMLPLFNMLYWYGVNNGIETCSSSKGWSLYSQYETMDWSSNSPQYNTNNISMQTENVIRKVCAVGTPKAIDFSNKSALKMIYTAQDLASGGGGSWISYSTSKRAFDTSTGGMPSYTNSPTLSTTNISSINDSRYIAAAAIQQSGQLTLYALWLE